ncbi:MAG TPA: hypothetical protein IAA04_10835 [Candidatus Lachnoclostridium pullistercoris]|uniref:Uncharacterized protein n=1 Tax=Candidatus Lachnoclostridium pullistercoris TaxID=2838632 RepID=A0A9D2PEE9_9FIRM|nr:hypothetical protein [Candidatus Lachnoclostridium pullistercoris]
MKKIVKSVLIGLAVTILGTMPTLASVKDIENQNTLNSHEVMVKIYDRRGNWIADGMLSISNPRNGRIGIYMTTQCHVPVDEIQMDIAVEQYDTGIKDWKQVDYLTYNFYPENGKNLTEATIDIQLAGHPANQTYRLQGWHTVFLNGSFEDLESATSGIQITN